MAMDRNQREKQLQAVFESTPLGIAICDPSGQFLEVNQAFMDILGYAREEILALSFIDITHPDDRAESLRLTGLVRRNATDSFHQEKRYITRKKGLVWGRTQVTALRDERGAVQFLVGVLEDVTERRETRRALEDSERRYRVLFEEAAEGILVVDTASRNILHANPAVGRLLGYTIDELTRLRVDDIHPPESLALVLERFGAQAQGKNRSAQNIPFTRKDGAAAFCDITSSPMEIDGRRCIVGFLQDVSDRVKAEQERQRFMAQMQQAQKMEAIGTLAGGIAHEFNNLLMGMQGNVSLLLMNKPLDSRDVVYLKKIEQSIDRAAELTRQVLGFARGGKYQVRATDLNRLVELTADMFGRSKKETAIRRNLHNDLWTVEADQAQIQQVLLELYINAWQAMPGGGELVIETANVTMTAADPEKPSDAAPGTYVRTRVTDTGVGMDQETQARIFEPFFTTKDRHQATGLGLSSAFGIVRNHNGFMTVESEKGRGSTFGIYLPATKPPAAVERAVTRSRSAGTKAVLLVEDEELVVDISRQMLERLGYRTLVARTGAEAVAVYEQLSTEIDLVILDMIMPGMGGGEVFERLKAVNPNVAVLLSSGYSLNGQATEIISRGCRGFIQKPFSIDALERKLNETLPE